MENPYSVFVGGAKNKKKNKKDKKDKGCLNRQKECVPNIDSKKRRSCSHKSLEDITIEQIKNGRKYCECDENTARCKITPEFTKQISFKQKKSEKTKKAQKAKTAQKPQVAKAAKTEQKQNVNKLKSKSKKQSVTCKDKDYLCALPVNKSRCQFLEISKLNKAEKRQAQQDCVCNPDTDKCLSTKGKKGQSLIAHKIQVQAKTHQLEIESRFRAGLQKILTKGALSQNVAQSIRHRVAGKIAQHTSQIEAERIATLAVTHTTPEKDSIEQLTELQEKTKTLLQEDVNPQKILISQDVEKFLVIPSKKIVSKFNELLGLYGIRIKGFKILKKETGLEIITRYVDLIKKFYRPLGDKHKSIKQVLRFVIKQGKKVKQQLHHIDSNIPTYRCYASVVQHAVEKIMNRSGAKNLKKDLKLSRRDYLTLEFALENLTDMVGEVYNFSKQVNEDFTDAILDFKFTHYGRIKNMLKARPDTITTKSRDSRLLSKISKPLSKIISKGLQKVEVGASTGKSLVVKVIKKAEKLLADGVKGVEHGAVDLKKTTQDILENIESEVKEAVEAVKDATTSVVKHSEKTGKTIIQDTSHTTKQVAEKLEKTVSGAISSGLEKIHAPQKIVSDTSGVIQDSEGVVGEISSKVSTVLKDGLSDVKKGTTTVVGLADKVGSTVAQGVKDGLGVTETVASDIGSNTKNIVENVVTTSKHASEDVVDLSEKIVGKVRGILAGVVQQVETDVSGVAGKVETTVSGVPTLRDEVQGVEIETVQPKSPEVERESFLKDLTVMVESNRTTMANIFTCGEGSFQLEYQQDYLTKINDLFETYNLQEMFSGDSILQDFKTASSLMTNGQPEPLILEATLKEFQSKIQNYLEPLKDERSNHHG